MRTALLQKYYTSKEYELKLLSRIDVLKQCEQEPLKITEFVLNSWALDPIAFIEQFGFIINPKMNNEIKPLFLFDYQKRVIEKIWQSEVSGLENEILIDKPREMGLTWVMVWYFIWRWSFTANWSGFLLSRSESEVDDGTSDPAKSLFGKIRWGLQFLPQWLMPEDFTPKGKKGTPTDMSLRISNPQMHSSIIGSTANANAGRGARYSLTLVDECFFVEHFLEVHRSLAHVANTRVYVSTSKTGRSYQKFVEMCEERGNHIELNWKDNPFKDQEWYDEKIKEAELDPEALKEIEVGYAVSSASQYYPEISQAKIAQVQYDRKRPLFVSLDFGRQDHTVIIFWQFDGFLFKILECVAKNKVDFDWFVPFMNREIAFNPEKYVGRYNSILERVRSWNKPLAYFGEPAHKQVHYPSNTSIQKELAKYGIRLMVNEYASSHEVRRKGTSLVLPKCVFNSDSDGVMELYDALLNSRYAGSVKGISKEALMKPAHDDEVGDYRSAFENGCVNIPRVLRHQREEIDKSLKENNFTGSLVKFLRI